LYGKMEKKKKLFCSGFLIYLNSNKKLFMWYENKKNKNKKLKCFEVGFFIFIFKEVTKKKKMGGEWSCLSNGV